MLKLLASYFMPVVSISHVEAESRSIISEESKSNVDNYEKIKLLGTGAFSQVHHVRCKRKGKDYAMKTMVNNELNKFVYHNELKVAQRLSPHGNIVQVHDQVEDSQKLYLISEYFSGVHIMDFFPEFHHNGSLEFEVKVMFVQIVRALCHLHAHGIAHLDIKSENLLINPETRVVKLIDFGISVIHPHHGPSCTQFSGSLHFAAPEILKREPFCPFKADVYSLGILLYSLVFNTLPFQPELRGSYARMGLHPAYEEWPQSPIRNGVSEQGLDLIRSMLVADPYKRIVMKEVFHHEWLDDVRGLTQEAD